MSKEFDKENNIFNGNDISFMTRPKDIKVMIWGYELCKGAEWKDFLDVVSKLGKEKADLEAKLAESEKSKEKFKVMYFNQCKDYEHLQEYVNDRENSNEWLTQKDNENLENEVKQLKQQLAEKEKELKWKPIEIADYIQDLTYFHAEVDSTILHIKRDKFDKIIKEAKEMK